MRVLKEKFVVPSTESSLLSYQQEKVLSNSFLSGQVNKFPFIWMFSLISSNIKINKLCERSLRLCQNDYVSSYDEFLSKQGLANNHTRNVKQLMTEFFKCLKGLFPPIMSELFILRSIPCSIRNGRETQPVTKYLRQTLVFM